MLSKIKSCGLMGIEGFIIEVETDISNGMPAFDIVGLADIAVKESKERVRAAIKNTGFEFPVRKITVNLAPANQKKEGSAYDLPIALGILNATEQVNSNDISNYMFIGELSLDGEVRPVNGVLSMAITALDEGIKFIVLPEENAYEAAVVKQLNVLPIKNLNDIIKHLNNVEKINNYIVDIDEIFSRHTSYEADFADVKGQENVKRALEVAASGSHNVLMVGSPGSGKTMIAKRLPSILPTMTFEEALEVTKIHSVAGILPPNTSLVTTRPFRSPHHTISTTGLAGGGKIPKPGEISLAHYGVLFLDELPEFSKDVLEVLRQPVEDGSVTISRVNATITYPSKTTLICAANPCRCGNFLDSDKECNCTPRQVEQYFGKLSAPLLDRIDMHIVVKPVKYNDLENDKEQECSADIRVRVNKARKLQLDRYKGLHIFSNSQLQASMLSKYCWLDSQCKLLMRNAFDKLGLSARAHSRILKVARTIADMDESDSIKQMHLAEAIQYRSFDRKFWKG